MAIVQISKIQQRSGNLVDLPQLDEAEFGWASDNKQLFIGKTTPIENVEVLTAYSNISFSQLDGAVGNLNISNSTIGTGQVLAYDGNNWINAGGTAGGVVDLGAVGNVTNTRSANVYPIGVAGTGQIGTVLIRGWTVVPDAQTPNWVTVSDSQTPNWVEIDAAA